MPKTPAVSSTFIIVIAFDSSGDRIFAHNTAFLLKTEDNFSEKLKIM